MAGTARFPGENSLLSGLFGVLKATAAARVQTGELWSALRLEAAAWQRRTSGETEPATVSELEAQGRQILSGRGVNIGNVNAYRRLAGQWRAARDRLNTLDLDEQIPAAAVFRSPWATTGGSGVPGRFRLRVNWHVTPQAGAEFDQWATYEIDAPLTTLGDAIARAEDAARQRVDSDQIYTAQSLDFNEAELELL